LISTVVMIQAQNRGTTNNTSKVAVSFEIIMTTSVTRPYFTTQNQTRKTKTNTKTDFLVWDRSCPKTDSLRPHRWALWLSYHTDTTTKLELGYFNKINSFVHTGAAISWRCLLFNRLIPGKYMLWY